MAMQYSCDYCGEPISDGRLMITLGVYGTAYLPDRGSTRYLSDHDETGRLGHYHASEERQCWLEMVDRIALVHAVSSDLGPDRDAVELRITQRQQRERERSERDERERDYRARVRDWHRRTREDRDALVVRALGRDRLTIRELMDRVNVALGSPTREEGWSTVDYGNTANIVKRLLREGRLQREREMFNKTHTRYRYFQRQALHGPIADLDRAYSDEGVA
jgi:hypothetical protein